MSWNFVDLDFLLANLDGLQGIEFGGLTKGKLPNAKEAICWATKIGACSCKDGSYKDESLEVGLCRMGHLFGRSWNWSFVVAKTELKWIMGLYSNGGVNFWFWVTFKWQSLEVGLCWMGHSTGLFTLCSAFSFLFLPMLFLSECVILGSCAFGNIGRWVMLTGTICLLGETWRHGYP